MSDSMTKVLEELTSVYKATDEVLASWNGEGNLQFPALMGMLAVKLNLDEKQVRETDPLVRYFVRKHPDWYVTRGAHGGIMRVSDRQKKEAARAQKASVKEQLRAAIDAKVAASNTESDLVLSEEDSE
jgi:hypothetical protein